ncbi:MAG: GIY-YIG nuclease family protein [Patescibacteria group bacterium]|jgi:putative endonuclease
MYFVYLLRSKKNKAIYIGSTNNLKLRLRQHNKGLVFSTKRYMPWELVYYEAYNNEGQARLREKRLKYNGNAIRELKRRVGL